MGALPGGMMPTHRTGRLAGAGTGGGAATVPGSDDLPRVAHTLLASSVAMPVLPAMACRRTAAAATWC